MITVKSIIQIIALFVFSYTDIKKNKIPKLLVALITLLGAALSMHDSKNLWIFKTWNAWNTWNTKKPIFI